MKQIKLALVAILIILPNYTFAKTNPKSQPNNFTKEQIELCKKYPHLCDNGPGCEDDEEEIVPAKKKALVTPSKDSKQDRDVK